MKPKFSVKDLKMIKEMVNTFKWVLFFLIPYISILTDRQAYIERGYYSFGGEMLVPIFCWICVFILQHLQNNLVKEIKRRYLTEAISEKVKHNAED